jgi:RHS repeat-associated protein
MRWCSDFSRRPRTTPLKQSKRITSYGFSVGASGNDDEDRLEASGIGFQPSIHTHTQGPSHEPLTVASQRAAHDAIVARHYAPQFAQAIDFQGGKQTIVICPSGTAAGSPNYTYVYASYIDEPEMGSGSGGLRYYHRNQQYSIIAVTDGGGSVVERYAYSAYGQVTIADASGSVISDSAIANRYTYIGREWDDALSLYHYRARLYDSVGGRFVSRDPLGYTDGANLYGSYFAIRRQDPSGMKSASECAAIRGHCTGAAFDGLRKCREDADKDGWGRAVLKKAICQAEYVARTGKCESAYAICLAGAGMAKNALSIPLHAH